MAPSRKDQDKDPVLAEYDIFITPDPAEDVLVLQFPIRSRELPYSREHGSQPHELRMKPRSGFIELDVELDPDTNFNNQQGVVWGTAMDEASASGLTSFGAATGFGAGAIKSRNSGNSNDHGSGMPFQKTTIGGQVLKSANGKPQYMLGTFKDNQLHLTRVDGIAQMRPHFHHLDAQAHISRASQQRETDEGRQTQAKSVTQSFKPNKDDVFRGAAVDKSLMQVAQEEKWTRFSYHDDEDEESYTVYKKLFVQDTNGSEQLTSSMTNEEYLDAISAPRHDPSGRKKKKPMTRKQREEIELDEDEIAEVATGDTEGENVAADA